MTHRKNNRCTLNENLSVDYSTHSVYADQLVAEQVKFNIKRKSERVKTLMADIIGMLISCHMT